MSVSRGALATVALSAALGLSACGDGAAGGPDSGVAVRDSAGVRIVESRAPAWREGAGWALSPEPLVAIGVTSGADEYQLFRVSDAMRLDDGRIVVLNGGTREVRFYGPDGRHLRSVGGPGQGPEEYQYPIRIFPGTADSLVVQDFMDRVYYDADGDFGRRATLLRDDWWGLFQPDGLSEGADWLPDGTILAPVHPTTREQPRPGPVYRPRMTFVRVSGDLARIDTLGVFGGTEQQVHDVGGRVTSGVPPFAASTRWGIDRDGTVVIVDGARPEAHRHEADGGHTLLRWSAVPEPVTAGEVEAWKDAQRAASWTQDQLPELERAWAVMDVRATKPYSLGVGLPARDGGTWVEVEADATGVSPAIWMIFDADGRQLGRIPLPAGFRVTDIGDQWVLGVRRAPDTEIETVLLYGLDKTGVTR